MGTRVTPPPILRALVALAGGISTVAAAAGVDPSNLARYLRGSGGLSARRLEDVETVLGRSRDQAGNSHVILIEVDEPDEEMRLALGWLFPNGAEVARTAWSRISRFELDRSLGTTLPPRAYALRQGETRCVVRLPSGRRFPDTLFPELPAIQWWNNDRSRAILDVADPVPWVQGELASVVFDAAWPDANPNPTLEDLLKEIKRRDISFFEVMRRIQLAEPRHFKPILRKPSPP